jgi:hypothetical protein
MELHATLGKFNIVGMYTGKNCGNECTYKLLSVLICRFTNLSIRTAASHGEQIFPEVFVSKYSVSVLAR